MRVDTGNGGSPATIRGRDPRDEAWTTARGAIGPDGGDWRPLVRPLGVLLHVLGEVRLLRVGLAAVLADVRLQVLRLAVLGDVFEEGGFVRKALVARVALEGFVRLVAPRVRLEVRELREGLQAARVPALVRLVT